MYFRRIGSSLACFRKHLPFPRYFEPRFIGVRFVSQFHRASQSDAQNSFFGRQVASNCILRRHFACVDFLQPWELWPNSQKPPYQPFFLCQAELLHVPYNASLASDNFQKDGDKGWGWSSWRGRFWRGITTLPRKEWNSLNLLADLNRQAERLAWGHEVSEYLLYLTFCASSHTLNYIPSFLSVNPGSLKPTNCIKYTDLATFPAAWSCMIAKECRQSLHGVQAMSWDFTHETQRLGRAHFAPYGSGLVVLTAYKRSAPS